MWDAKCRCVCFTSHRTCFLACIQLLCYPTHTKPHFTITMSPSLVTAPSERIDLGDITHNNVGQLRKLNTVIFPVNYGDKFYNDVLHAGELAKLGKK